MIVFYFSFPPSFILAIISIACYNLIRPTGSSRPKGNLYKKVLLFIHQELPVRLCNGTNYKGQYYNTSCQSLYKNTNIYTQKSRISNHLTLYRIQIQPLLHPQNTDKQGNNINTWSQRQDSHLNCCCFCCYTRAVLLSQRRMHASILAQFHIANIAQNFNFVHNSFSLAFEIILSPYSNTF